MINSNQFSLTSTTGYCPQNYRVVMKGGNGDFAEAEGLPGLPGCIMTSSSAHHQKNMMKMKNIIFRCCHVI
jgi:hypothetical protein